MTLVGDRGRFGAYELAGGAAGVPADHNFLIGAERFKPAHGTKLDRQRMVAGDGVSLRTPGGGGYGPAAARSGAARAADVADGYTPG